MNTFRTSTEITPEHRLVLALPPEMPLGTAEVVVTVSPQNGSPAPAGNLSAISVSSTAAIPAPPTTNASMPT